MVALPTIAQLFVRTGLLCFAVAVMYSAHCDVAVANGGIDTTEREVSLSEPNCNCIDFGDLTPIASTNSSINKVLEDSEDTPDTSQHSSDWLLDDVAWTVPQVTYPDTERAGQYDVHRGWPHTLARSHLS